MCYAVLCPARAGSIQACFPGVQDSRLEAAWLESGEDNCVLTTVAERTGDHLTAEVTTEVTWRKEPGSIYSPGVHWSLALASLHTRLLTTVPHC